MRFPLLMNKQIAPDCSLRLAASQQEQGGLCGPLGRRKLLLFMQGRVCLQRQQLDGGVFIDVFLSRRFQLELPDLTFKNFKIYPAHHILQPSAPLPCCLLTVPDISPVLLLAGLPQ